MMRRRVQIEFKDWLRLVNSITLARHHMSIYELEDDVSRETCHQAYMSGTEPGDFVEREVAKVFQFEE